MLKKLCLFVCFSAGASIAHAQAISAVKFSTAEALTGQAIEVWPEFSGPAGRGGECAVLVNFGDGGNQQVKIDPTKPPVKAGHIYQSAGNYVVTIEGKTIFRGFNSTGACEGITQSAALTVRDAKAVAQEAEKKAAAERNANVDPTARLLVLAQVAAQAGVAAQKAGQANGLDAQAQAQTTRDFDAGLGKLTAGQLFGLADQLNAQNLPEYARMALRKLVIQYSDHPLAATAAKMLAESAAAPRAPAPAHATASASPAAAPAKEAEARVIQQQEEEMQRLAQQRQQREQKEQKAPVESAAAAKPGKKLTAAECDAAMKKSTAQIDAVEKAAPRNVTKALETKFTLYVVTEGLNLVEQGCKITELGDAAQARKLRDEKLAECKKNNSRAEECSGKKPW